MIDVSGTAILDLPEAPYSIDDLAAVMTPVLAIYPEAVRNNIEFTIELLKSKPTFWRPHVKTAKSEAIMRILADYGLTSVKCATTLELETACRAGAEDVLLAYPVHGATAKRILRIALKYPGVRISTIVEDPRQIEQWKGTPISLFVDINPGMNRTGVEQSKSGKLVELATAILGSGLEFRGLHYYDGHLRTRDLASRIAKAHVGYDALVGLIEILQATGIPVAEVNTSGTPTLPAALAYSKLNIVVSRHSVSPGTVIYSDIRSLEELPCDYGYKPAALIVSRVVSHPCSGIITCDAGLKVLSVDSGTPNCIVLGWPQMRALQPSEEHLPFEIPADTPPPTIGALLYLVPRHVCPTVNNCDHAIFVHDGKIRSIEQVSARGRESPCITLGGDLVEDDKISICRQNE